MIVVVFLGANVEHRLDDRGELQRRHELDDQPCQGIRAEFVRTKGARHQHASDEVAGADNALIKEGYNPDWRSADPLRQAIARRFHRRAAGKAAARESSERQIPSSPVSLGSRGMEMAALL